MRRLWSASQDDTESRARRPVGSGDHKTRPEDQRSTKTRPGQPRVPPRRGHGCRYASELPRLRQGLQPAENRRLRPGPDLPETHPGCVSGGTRSLRCLSPGTTGRTGPTVGRMMQRRDGERRIRPRLQPKGPDRASAPAGRRIGFSGARKVSRPVAAFLDARRGIIRIKLALPDASRGYGVDFQGGTRRDGNGALRPRRRHVRTMCIKSSGVKDLNLGADRSDGGDGRLLDDDGRLFPAAERERVLVEERLEVLR